MLPGFTQWDFGLLFGQDALEMRCDAPDFGFSFGPFVSLSCISFFLSIPEHSFIAKTSLNSSR